MELTSPAFGHGQPIPQKFTCDGENISPELSFKGVPDDAHALALVMEDPDAPGGTWDHWIVMNLPADADGLPRGAGSSGALPAGALHGSNSWKKRAYSGPCPPSGTHRYVFTLYALPEPMTLDEGVAKDVLEQAMQGRVLARAQLEGTYAR